MHKLRMKVCFSILLLMCGMLKVSKASDEPVATPLVVEVFIFDNCEQESGEPFPMAFENITMRMDIDTKQLFISGSLDMKIPWSTDLKGHIAISKCLTKDDVNSCNKYYENTINDICRYLPDKTRDWSPFIEHINSFDPNCPIKAGIYSVADAPISTGNLENMKSALGVWHIAFAAWKGEKKVLCTDSGVEIKRARRGRRKSAAPVDV